MYYSCRRSLPVASSRITLFAKEIFPLEYMAETSMPRAISSSMRAMSCAARAELKPVFPTCALNDSTNDEIDMAANLAAKSDEMFLFIIGLFLKFNNIILPHRTFATVVVHTRLASPPKGDCS